MLKIEFYKIRKYFNIKIFIQFKFFYKYLRKTIFIIDFDIIKNFNKFIIYIFLFINKDFFLSRLNIVYLINLKYL